MVSWKLLRSGIGGRPSGQSLRTDQILSTPVARHIGGSHPGTSEKSQLLFSSYRCRPIKNHYQVAEHELCRQETRRLGQFWKFRSSSPFQAGMVPCFTLQCVRSDPFRTLSGVSSAYRAVVGFEHEIQQDLAQDCPEKGREFGGFFGLCSSFSRIHCLRPGRQASVPTHEFTLPRFRTRFDKSENCKPVLPSIVLDKPDGRCCAAIVRTAPTWAGTSCNLCLCADRFRLPGRRLRCGASGAGKTSKTCERIRGPRLR